MRSLMAHGERVGILSLFCCIVTQVKLIGAVVPPSHSWDFRGCTTGVAIVDAYSALVATPVDGPLCSSTGISFDGVNDYVNIDSWSWGGATSFEVYVDISVIQINMRIFVFGDGTNANINSAVLYIPTTSPTVEVCFHNYK